MIKLENIVKIYNEGKANEVKALRGIDLTINDGEMAAIIGESGSGKSTLLNILGCIDIPTGGAYYYDDINTSTLSGKARAEFLNRKIGFVLQDFGLMLDRSVYHNISSPLVFNPHIKSSQIKEKIKSALLSVGLPRYINSVCGELSGGQKQRVAIARAIVNEPSLILADEPTGALDTKTSAEIIELFKSLNQQGKTVIIVTHDPNVAQRCHRIIEISDGKIVSEQE